MMGATARPSFSGHASGPCAALVEFFPLVNREHPPDRRSSIRAFDFSRFTLPSNGVAAAAIEANLSAPRTHCSSADSSKPIYLICKP